MENSSTSPLCACGHEQKDHPSDGCCTATSKTIAPITCTCEMYRNCQPGHPIYGEGGRFMKDLLALCRAPKEWD